MFRIVTGQRSSQTSKVKSKVEGQKVKMSKVKSKVKGQIKGHIKGLKPLKCNLFHFPTVYTNQEINEYSYLNGCKYTLSHCGIII